MSMVESIEKYSGVTIYSGMDLNIAVSLAKKHEIKLEKFQDKIGHIILAFFEKYVEKNLIQPTFIYDYPIETSPLSKKKLKDEEIADRFELFIGGMEFANGYSELNDPKEQKERFKEQKIQKDLGMRKLLISIPNLLIL